MENILKINVVCVKGKEFWDFKFACVDMGQMCRALAETLEKVGFKVQNGQEAVIHVQIQKDGLIIKDLN